MEGSATVFLKNYTAKSGVIGPCISRNPGAETAPHPIRGMPSLALDPVYPSERNDDSGYVLGEALLCLVLRILLGCPVQTRCQCGVKYTRA